MGFSKSTGLRPRAILILFEKSTRAINSKLKEKSRMITYTKVLQGFVSGSGSNLPHYQTGSTHESTRRY